MTASIPPLTTPFHTRSKPLVMVGAAPVDADTKPSV